MKNDHSIHHNWYISAPEQGEICLWAKMQADDQTAVARVIIASQDGDLVWDR
jgi:hypothetical protein